MAVTVASPSQVPAPLQTASFRKPVPLQIPIHNTPAAAPMAEVVHPTPESGHHQPASILIPRTASPGPVLQVVHPETASATAGAGPSRAQPHRQNTGASGTPSQYQYQSQDSEEERAGDSGAENAPHHVRPLSYVSSGSGGAGVGASGGNELQQQQQQQHGQQPTTPMSPYPSVRRPARAVSHSDRTLRAADRSPYPPMPTPAPTGYAGNGNGRTTMPPTPGVQGPGELVLSQEGMRSHRSGIDWIVPNITGGGGAGANGREARRQSTALSNAGTLNGNAQKNILERLKPTVEDAERERNIAAAKGECGVYEVVGRWLMGVSFSWVNSEELWVGVERRDRGAGRARRADDWGRCCDDRATGEPPSPFPFIPPAQPADARATDIHRDLDPRRALHTRRLLPREIARLQRARRVRAARAGARLVRARLQELRARPRAPHDLGL